MLLLAVPAAAAGTAVDADVAALYEVALPAAAG